MGRRMIVLVVAISLGVALCISGWIFLRSCRLDPNDLKRPLQVTGARAAADGGTLEIRLVDAEGKSFSAKRVGSLASEPLRQELRVVSYRWGVPLACDAPKGSPIEAVIKEALRTWLSDKLTADQRARLERNDQDALRLISFDVIASYDLVSWLDRRQ